MKTSPLQLFPFSLLCAFATAQTSAQPAANRFVPADSWVVARVSAPAKWQKQFSKTQIGKLFDGPTLAPVMEQGRKALAATMDQLRQSGAFDAELLERMLDQYSGDFVFSLQVDWEDLGSAMMEDRPPAFSLVVALTPDGSFDLPALATAIETAVEKHDAQRRPMRDLTVGDLRLRVTADEGPVQATVPAMIDGHLVMVLGADLDKQAARLLGADRRYEGALGDKPLWVHARLDQAVPKLLSAIDEQVGGMLPFDLMQMMTDLGLAALSGLTMSIDAVDKQAAIDAEVSFAGDPGYFGAFLVDKPPTMTRFVPANANWFGLSHVDLNVAYSVVRKIWDQLAGQVPMSVEDAEAAFADSCKVRLKEDLLAHVGTEMLSVQAEVEDGEEDDEADLFAAFGASCFALELRDGKAFGQSLETALRAHGLHAARKTEDYGDAKIHRLRLAGLLEVEYVVTDEMLIVVPGKNERGGGNLRAILDARKQGADSVPAALQKATAGLPAGWTGISVAPFDGSLKTLIKFAELGAAQSADPDEMEVLGQSMQTIRSVIGDAKRLGIENMVSATYATPRSMVVRMRL